MRAADRAWDALSEGPCSDAELLGLARRLIAAVESRQLVSTSYGAGPLPIDQLDAWLNREGGS